MIRKVDYVMCVPGDNSSRLQALNEEVVRGELGKRGKQVVIRHAKGPNVYVARNECMKMVPGSDPEQIPFSGMIDYDRMIWIDSDNIININALDSLLSRDVDIVASWYRMYLSGDIDGTNHVAAGKLNQYGFTPYTVQEMEGKMEQGEGMMEVDYVGFGMVVIKRGVMESLPYPWFRGGLRHWTSLHTGKPQVDVETDDVGWCQAVRDKGYKIYIDAQSRIYHQKMAVL